MIKELNWGARFYLCRVRSQKPAVVEIETMQVQMLLLKGRLSLKLLMETEVEVFNHGTGPDPHHLYPMGVLEKTEQVISLRAQ